MNSLRRPRAGRALFRHCCLFQFQPQQVAFVVDGKLTFVGFRFIKTKGLAADRTTNIVVPHSANSQVQRESAECADINEQAILVQVIILLYGSVLPWPSVA